MIGRLNFGGLSGLGGALGRTVCVAVCLALAVTRPAAGSVTLGAVAAYPTGAPAAGLAVGDFNGDGKQDIAVVTDDSAHAPPYSGSLEIFLGRGDGTFTPGPVYPTGPARAVVASDFNHEGRTDLAVAHLRYYANGSSMPSPAEDGITVFLGNGDGTFRRGAELPVHPVPMGSLAVADINRDGQPDLLATNNQVDPGGANSFVVSSLLGAGDGTFSAGPSIPSQNPASRIAAADVDGDGTPDLVVLDGGGLSVYRGRGDGTFTAGWSSGPAAVAGARSLQLADLKGEGRPDAVVGVSAFTSGSSAGIEVFSGNPDGSFGAPAFYPLGDSTTTHADSLASADFARHGKPDVAVAIGRGIAVLEGNGDGTLRPAQEQGLDGSSSAIVTADFDGNGRPDLAVAEGHHVSGFALGREVWPGALEILLNGQTAPLQLWPRSIDLGSQALGAGHYMYLPPAHGLVWVGDHDYVGLRDPGPLPAHISRIAIEGPDAQDFFVEPGRCLGDHPPTSDLPDNCLVTVNFNPLSTGSKAAWLTFYDNTYGAPHRIPVHAIATPGGDGRTSIPLCSITNPAPPPTPSTGAVSAKITCAIPVRASLTAHVVPTRTRRHMRAHSSRKRLVALTPGKATQLTAILSRADRHRLRRDAHRHLRDRLRLELTALRADGRRVTTTKLIRVRGRRAAP
jgi:hypothetical protein